MEFISYFYFTPRLKDLATNILLYSCNDANIDMIYELIDLPIGKGNPMP